MYLGLTIAYLGVLLLEKAFWPLPLLALPLWVLQAKVIPFEERTIAGALRRELPRLPAARPPLAVEQPSAFSCYFGCRSTNG